MAIPIVAIIVMIPAVRSSAREGYFSKRVVFVVPSTNFTIKSFQARAIRKEKAVIIAVDVWALNWLWRYLVVSIPFLVVFVISFLAIWSYFLS